MSTLQEMRIADLNDKLRLAKLAIRLMHLGYCPICDTVDNLHPAECPLRAYLTSVASNCDDTTDSDAEEFKKLYAEFGSND